MEKSLVIAPPWARQKGFLLNPFRFAGGGGGGGGGGAVGISVSKAGSAAASQTTSAVTSSASGSVFVVGVTWGSAAFTSVTDSKSNTYTQIGTEIANGARKSRFYYTENATGGSSHTFTATVGGSDEISVSVVELTGMKTSASLDQTATATFDAATPYVGGSITTTQAAELVVSFFGGDSGSNPATQAESGLGTSTVYSQITNGSFWTCAMAVSIKSATGTFTPSWTEGGSGSGHVHCASFKVGP